MSTLLELIEQHAPPVPVDTSFWLDVPEALWCVRSGALDIFSQRRTADGRVASARSHLFRAMPGGLVLAVDGECLHAGSSFLAVALPGTQVCRLTQSDFGHLADVGGVQSEALAMLEEWVSTSIRGPLRPLPPKHYQLLGDAGEFSAASEECLLTTGRLAWMAVHEGQAWWMGRADCVVGAGAGPLVLNKDVWIRASGFLRGELVNPSELLADGRIWRALALHYRFVLAHALGLIAEQGEADSVRLAQKAQRADALAREAMASLLAVGASGTAQPVPAPTGDALFDACARIGHHQGIVFRAPQAFESDAFDRDPVGTLAAASGLRFRRVALKDEWWSVDAGPMLATVGDGRRWVALLPVGNRRYELHDPVSGRIERVATSVATTLGAFAYVFYRPFPATAIGMREILRFGMRGMARDVAFVVAMGVLMGVLTLVLPIAGGLLIDSIVPTADRIGLWQVTCALVMATIASALFEFARAVALLRIEGKMDASVQAAVWDRVLKLPVPFFRDYAAGDLAQRINGVNTIRHALSGSAVSGLLGGIFSLFNLALLFFYSMPLALLAVLLVMLALLVVGIIGYLKLRYERRLADVAGRLSGMVFQYLRGIAKLRASAAENRAFSNWAELFTRLRRMSFSVQQLANVERTFFTGFPLLANAAVFAAIGMLLFQSGAHITTGEFIAFSAAFGAFLSALFGLTTTALGLLRLVPVYERARPILETLPESDDTRHHPGELQGAIEVVALGFRYGDGPDILHDVSFSIRPGGYVALVGASGSGKSTLFRLLLGFETPSVGSIFYDAQCLADLNLDAVRRQLGVVLQSGQLTSGDIFSNIVGSSQLTLEDAWEAARMVGLDADIEQMPMGMHTVISEGTSTISGGQRQRILIARAIVHRPPVIFFDEATSALDNQTQAIVTESLGRLRSTRIVIAHRLSTVVKADRILVLQDSRIVQNGSYEKLIAEPGPFADLARRQML